VRFDAGATAVFSNLATLQILGTSTATTTIDRQSAGNYGLTMASSTLNAQYYKFSNMNATGLYLAGSTTGHFACERRLFTGCHRRFINDRFFDNHQYESCIANIHREVCDLNRYFFRV